MEALIAGGARTLPCGYPQEVFRLVDRTGGPAGSMGARTATAPLPSGSGRHRRAAISLAL